MGGDVLPNIEGQAEALEKMLVQFKASYLVSPGDEILPNKKTTFLTIVDTLLKEPAKSQFSLSIRESTALWQSKLYHWIKRTIRERNTIPGAEATEHDLFCYVDGIASEWDLYKELANTCMYSIDQVIRDITDEIIEQRKRHPQQVLF